MSRRRVAVVFGGRSAEHEISVVSARSVLAALDPDRFEAVPVGVTKAGRWVLLPQGPPPLPESGGLVEVAAAGPAAALEASATGHDLVVADGARVGVDVVFPVLHGPHGEDGSVQGFLEMLGIPYVGSGVLASALGMDKALQKAVFRDAGIPVVDHEVVREREWREDPEAVEARAEHLGFPAFVKPSSLGSSVGISRVAAPAGLGDALDAAFAHGPKALVERAAEGCREIECAVLGNDDPVASLAGEIVPRGHDFYDYDAKYLDAAGADLVVPAPLDAATLAEVQRLAVAAFLALDCAGMARVDFFLGPDGTLVVNELNTIPGFTGISMYPRLWEASGLPYRDLVTRLVDLAVERSDAERARG
ncbi:MAG: D-alanine--D-alanine ligase family protein [Actinomycetota bacterium]